MEQTPSFLLESTWPQCRWAVDISRWSPSEEEFQFLCEHMILPEESEHCKRFKFLDDRKRALVSILLQRLAGALLLSRRMKNKGQTGTDPRTIEIGKTKGRKPYIDTTKHPFMSCERSTNDEDLVNFNYNVSHDGKYVVLASETHCVCGCDVSSTHSLNKRRGKRFDNNNFDEKDGTMCLDELEKLFGSFKKQLSAKEWERVYGMPGDSTARICNRFCMYWSLKEAFVKAIGMGLGYDLGNVEFDVDDETGIAFATINPDTHVSQDWCFYVHELSDGHWASIARGPPEAIVDAHGGFRKTFQCPELSRDVLNTHVFMRREPSFVHASVRDVLDLYWHHIGPSDARRAEYIDRFAVS